MKSLTITQFIFFLEIGLSPATLSFQEPDTVYVIGQDTSNDSSVTRPAGGWEVFNRLLLYPGDARQSRRGCALSIDAYPDSGGGIERLEVFGSHPDSSFLRSAERALHSTHWVISSRGNFPIPLEIMFVPRAQNQPLAFVIESNPTGHIIRYTSDSTSKWSDRDSEVVASDSLYAVFPAHGIADPNGNTNASPLCGWDSLLHRFSFPKMAKDAGFQASLLAQIHTDSLGDLYRISIQPDYPVFVEPISKILRSVQWSPARRHNRPVEGKLFLPFFFSFRDLRWHHRLIVEAR